MWKVVGEVIPKQNNKHNGYGFDKISDKAEEFNSFFSSVSESTFRRSQEELESESEFVADRPHFNSNVNSAFRPKPVDANTVILTVKHLNTTTSIGSDGIALRFLRDALCVIVLFLTCIVNTSVVTGVFPEA